MKSVWLKPCLLACVVLIITGCATATTTHMSPVEGATEFRPEPGKSLVVFMRPSRFGYAILSTVYDGEDYIGTVPANTRFAWQTSPGEHMFMVIGESADFMKADLAPDKTYFARIVARMGVWKARFSLVPYNHAEPESDLQAWLNSSTPLITNENGKAWARDNAASIREKHDKYLPQWQKKPEANRIKQTLLKSSGR